MFPPDASTRFLFHSFVTITPFEFWVLSFKPPVFSLGEFYTSRHECFNWHDMHVLTDMLCRVQLNVLIGMLS